jgi:hypothetical protein
MSTTLLSLSTSQLKQALAIREKIEALERELEQVVAGASPVTNGTGDKRKWTMSPGARAKIAAAQRARWAKQKTGAPAGKPSKGKRKMSAAARAKIAAVARARWAKAKAAGRSAL